MKATVYRIHNRLGVVHLTDGESDYVAECIIRDDETSVIPQSVRKLEDIYETDAEIADDPSHEDILNRMALRVIRLRDRLAEFEADDVSEGDPRELVLEAIACRDELNAMIQRFTLVKL